MAVQSLATLEAQVNALDRDTAQRVARLVFECRASLELALIAIQEADRRKKSYAGDRQLRPRRRLAHILDIWRSAMHRAQ
jgi:hypothetical protein